MTSRNPASGSRRCQKCLGRVRDDMRTVNFCEHGSKRHFSWLISAVESRFRLKPAEHPVFRILAVVLVTVGFGASSDASAQASVSYTYVHPRGVPAACTTIYIAPRKDRKPGSGTPSNPFNASSAAKFDALIQRFSRNAAIYYAPGVYYTKGWQPGHPQTANPNCYHIGAGIDQTIVRLDPTAVLESGGNGSITIFACDYNQRSDGFEVWNMTVDGNADQNRQFQSGTGIIALIGCQGNNILIQGDKFMGWGTKGGEVSPIFIQPSALSFSGVTFSHCHLQNCLFTLPATGNLDGTSIACVTADRGVPVVDWQILDNTFTNVASDFTYSHALCGLFQQGNTVNGCETGFYAEPGSGSSAGTNNLSPVVIQNNTFIGVPFVCVLNFHPNGQFGPLTFANNKVILPNEDGIYSVGVNIKGSVSLTPAVASIIVSGNEFKGEQPSDACYYRGVDLSGFNTSNLVGNLVLQDNKFDSYVPSDREFVVNSNAVPNVHESGNVYCNGREVKCVRLRPGEHAQPESSPDRHQGTTP
jgi:hypothetical protein